MAKTENVFVRVEPQIKEQAELILKNLGIPMSNAVGMFLQQVVLQKGIPFDVKLPSSYPLTYGELSESDFDAIISEGVCDYEAGRIHKASEIREQVQRGFTK